MFSIFEPLHLRLGYQRLDGDTLFEWGVRSGIALDGRYEVADARRALDGAIELGHYVAVRVLDLRLDLGASLLFPPALGRDEPLALAHAELCAFPRSLAFCGDVSYVRGLVATPSGSQSTITSWYSGVSVGLTR